MTRLVQSMWLAVFFLVIGCSNSQRLPEGDGDADGDTDADGDADGDGDADLECGDERQPLDVDPQPIVNGDDSWNPEVVALTDGQALAVGALMANDGGWSNSCTATLVAPNLVLTAAHCVTDFWTGETSRPSEVRFAVGEDALRPEHTFTVSEIGRHPSYNPRGGGDAEHDVAIIVLQESALEALPHIRPIPMNCEPIDAEAFLNQDVQNVGYGITEPFMGWPPPPDNSIRYWAVEEVVDLTGFDFVVDGHGEAAVCNGDSGGPSLWTMPDGVIRVMGTVSWGDPSCVDEDHFARVDDSCDFFDDYFEGCDDVTNEGFCDDSTAVFCESGSVLEIDCEALGRDCGDIGGGLMRCLDALDPCEGETFAGRCTDDRAIWCEDDEVQSVDCGDELMTCALNDDGLSRCVGDSDLCEDLGWEGACEGDTAVWCDDEDRVRRRQCDDCGQPCGWSDEFNGFYCL